jgi:hypothetical protein
MASRSFAIFSRSAGDHVQRVRNGMAETFCVLQRHALKELEHGDHLIAHVAFDETSEPCKLDCSTTDAVSVMTLHLKIMHRRDNNVKVFEVVIPPCIIDSTTGEHLLAALYDRLPLSLDELAEKASRFTLLLNTDSGASCLRVGRFLGSKMPTVPSVCRMHQGALSLLAIVLQGGIASSVFCAALLIKRQKVQCFLRIFNQRS